MSAGGEQRTENLLEKSLDIRCPGERPTPRFREMIMSGESVGSSLSRRQGRKRCLAVPHEIKKRKPDINRVEPATVFWGRHATDPVGGIAQRGVSADQTLQKSLRAFDTHILVIPAQAGDQADQRFPLGRRELITPENGRGQGVRLDEGFHRFPFLSPHWWG